MFPTVNVPDLLPYISKVPANKRYEALETCQRVTACSLKLGRVVIFSLKLGRGQRAMIFSLKRHRVVIFSLKLRRE